MPLVATRASAAYGAGFGKVLATAADTGAMFPLQVITVGPTAVSDVTFTNIPSTYTHLQIRGINLQDTIGNVWMRLNSDTASNYSTHDLAGDGASASVYAGANQDKILVGVGRSTSASYAGAAVIDILDYANTNKYKTTRALAGADVNGATGYIVFRSGSWRNTNAITTIKIFPDSGNFNQYTQFALYGVKSA